MVGTTGSLGGAILGGPEVVLTSYFSLSLILLPTLSSATLEPNQQGVQLPVAQGSPNGRQFLSIFNLEQSGRRLKLARQEKRIFSLISYHIQGNATLSLVQPASDTYPLAEMRLAAMTYLSTRITQDLEGFSKGKDIATGDS